MLIQGYVALLADSFGIDGLVTARADRFLPNALQQIKRVHAGRPAASAADPLPRKRKAMRTSGGGGGGAGGGSDAALAAQLVEELRGDLDVCVP
jgi:hypothetical protein